MISSTLINRPYMYIKRHLTLVLFTGLLQACGGEAQMDAAAPSSATLKEPVIHSEYVYFLGSSTIFNMQNAISTWKENYQLETVNHAKGGELIDSMCIRMGALPALAKFQSPQINTETKNYFEQDWPKDPKMKTFTATIEGVEGDVGIDNTGYYFIPNKSFSLDSNLYHQIHAKTHFEKNSVFVVNLGKNNLLGDSTTYGQPPYILSRSNECIKWIKEHVTDRVVVMGHFTSKAPSASLIGNVISSNSSLKNAYGSNYFDLKGYVESDEIWKDSGITPTQLDRDAINKSYLAPSLAADSVHLNSNAAATSVEKIYKFIQNKQWVK